MFIEKYFEILKMKLHHTCPKEMPPNRLPVVCKGLSKLPTLLQKLQEKKKVNSKDVVDAILVDMPIQAGLLQKFRGASSGKTPERIGSAMMRTAGQANQVCFLVFSFFYFFSYFLL